MNRGNIMKKTFKLENLECANCAAKMENAINALDGVEAKINFFAAKLTIEAADEIFESTLIKAQKLISGIERDCKIVK